MTESSSAATYHEFTPDAKHPEHCAVCWQYKIWWRHNSPESKPADSSNELIRLQGVPESEWHVESMDRGMGRGSFRVCDKNRNWLPQTEEQAFLMASAPRLQAQVETLTQGRDREKATVERLMKLLDKAEERDYLQQKQVETLTQEREHFRQQTRAIDDEYEEERKLTSELKQQLTDALRINSALRESMKEAMDELDTATGYRALNAFDMLNAALTQSAEEPSGAANSWLIFFEDADVRPEIYTDSESARSAFEVRKQSWSCHLFVEVPEPPSPIPAAQEEQS